MKISIPLQTPASEMAQEEIPKQLFFLTTSLRSVSFSDAGRTIHCELGEEGASDGIEAQILEAVCRVQRGLRGLQRRVVFRSSRMNAPALPSATPLPGVHFLGEGQVALSGTALKLFRYFDRAFRDLGKNWGAVDLLTPTLVPTDVVGRCDYFRSFPQNVTFASHLQLDPAVVAGFRGRHEQRDDLDNDSLGDMAIPEACLSPAVCYHVYHLHEGSTIADSLVAYGICGKCFRYEATNMKDLRRLWDFTMRESVFLGTRETVLAKRERAIEEVARFLEDHRLAGEIRTASDPFFVAPDAIAKTYFQLSSETKFEISLLLPGEERLAAGSFNYHTDFFGRAFNVALQDGTPMHSVCVAFGLERWVNAFLAQHGTTIALWPNAVSASSEFSD